MFAFDGFRRTRPIDVRNSGFRYPGLQAIRERGGRAVRCGRGPPYGSLATGARGKRLGVAGAGSMTDVVDRATRRRMMSGIRGKNTGPEMIVRRGLHARGFRYRLHDGGLPGKPDLVFVRYNAAMFVNGCFWHGHGCHLFKWPSSRARFWRQKISANRERDAETLLALRKAGWRVAIVWELRAQGQTAEERQSGCGRRRRMVALRGRVPGNRRANRWRRLA